MISCANPSRSTAKAPPAGTLVISAHSIISEFIIRISSFKSPTAFASPSALRELLQTSSARLSDLCAGDFLFGFISINVTLTPRFAICHAASHPASPAPITVTLIFQYSPRSHIPCRNNKLFCYLFLLF